ncbi:hypothetical protein MJM95_31680, partial [Salmonella enterica subsp. enterica serovar Anatum]|nr:hypothetical protein [Salmonella enterica subsp. enterica serovar Anatum]
TGGAMFIGLMVGGVLADRYERKKVILLARGTCGIGFIGLCVNHCAFAGFRQLQQRVGITDLNVVGTEAFFIQFLFGNGNNLLQ